MPQQEPPMTGAAAPATGEVLAPPDAGASDIASEDMVVIQLPRAQLQTVVDAFKEITGMLEGAASKADADIAGQQVMKAGPGGPPDMNSPEALAAEIEGMSGNRGGGMMKRKGMM